MNIDKGSRSSGSNEASTDRLEVLVSWNGERQLSLAAPAAIEVAGLLMGLEEAYEAFAAALGYPPHFLKMTSIQNPELKLGLEGGKDIIEAIRALLEAVPSLVANLFRPKAAWNRAQLEAQVRTKELEAKSASAEAQKMNAEADTAEATARKIRADREVAELRKLTTELQAIPIRADETAHAVLNDVVAAVTHAEPSRRLAFIADTARYAVVAHSFDANPRVSLVPSPRIGVNRSNVNRSK